MTLRWVTAKFVKTSEHHYSSGAGVTSAKLVKASEHRYKCHHQSDGQVVGGTDYRVNGLGSLPTRDTDCRFSVQCKVIELHAFYDAITGLTEFIISIFNSVKTVNMP